jgi:hypothetical protein
MAVVVVFSTVVVVMEWWGWGEVCKVKVSSRMNGIRLRLICIRRVYIVPNAEPRTSMRIHDINGCQNND